VLKFKLIQALAPTLNANAARLKTLCLLIEAIIRHRSVNLTVLSTTQDGSSCSNESRYRRFQDFFFKASFALTDITATILSRLPKPKEGYLLAIDRTNWQFGRKDINFLVIAVIVGKVSIPLVWKVLPTKTRNGNSNRKDRIKLMRELLKALPAKEIQALTMDREFIGKQWLSWLDEQGVGYVVRIKKNVWVGERTAEDRAKTQGPNPRSRQDIFGLDLFFGSKVMKKANRQSHLMVVSNRFAGKEALRIYWKRWGIERLFAHLKKKGFDLESTHITAAFKLETLFGIVVLAFLFSFAWGCHLRHSGKKNNAASRRKSFFRLGLEDILARLQPTPNGHLNLPQLRELHDWMKSPKFNSIFLV